MTTLAPTGTQRGPNLRRPGDALAEASIGAVPILWNNVDLADLRPTVEVDTVLDEIVRTGYEGTQEGRGFPRGEPLRAMLAARGLRLAEVYASIPCTEDGPAPGALEIARDRLAVLHEGGGEVLVAALDGSPERAVWSGRAGEGLVPRLSDDGWRRLASLVDRLAAEAIDLGHALAWHQHTGTFVETPAEADRLFAETDPARVGICLDVGHWTVGGGDPVDALRRYGPRVTHVHLKDVDPDVLAGLRDGRTSGWDDAIRARLFTELGGGLLDLPAILGELHARGFAGWLMVEQDSCWGPPSESAAIGRRVLAAELRRLGNAGS
ncbi:MAG TPA: sugar phosphate isomerase/epimerase [Vitreimonas sp.]|nr:sugar phosphate isomerase/epimerase [Vitreimonas sp.]